MMWCTKHSSYEYGTEISLNSLQMKVAITQNYYQPLCKTYLCTLLLGVTTKTHIIASMIIVLF